MLLTNNLILWFSVTFSPKTKLALKGYFNINGCVSDLLVFLPKWNCLVHGNKTKMHNTLRSMDVK